MILPSTATLEDRFWTRVLPEPNSGCWLWVGAYRDSGNKGYGRLYVGRKLRYAHAVAWELYRGAIPEGMEIDHLCRNEICVNPQHLEPVPHTVNLARGYGPPAVNSRKTHCKRGHEFTVENTMWITTRPGKRDRRCRTCVQIWERKYKREWRKGRGAK